MAENADRVYKRKRLKNPNDDSIFVDIPVLYQAKFRTAQEQYQDRWIYLENSSASHRKTRVQRVTNPDTNDFIDVERIESFTVKSIQEQAQEYEYLLSNNDPAPIQPDGSDSPSHQRKHVVRYFHDNDTNSGIWVDTELIDELRIVSATEQYQEYRINLLNADVGDTIPGGSGYTPTLGNCDSSLELAPDDDGLDPPYRLDPFQNIVNVHWAEIPTGGLGAPPPELVATVKVGITYLFSGGPYASGFPLDATRYSSSVNTILWDRTGSHGQGGYFEGTPPAGIVGPSSFSGHPTPANPTLDTFTASVIEWSLRDNLGTIWPNAGPWDLDFDFTFKVTNYAPPIYTYSITSVEAGPLQATNGIPQDVSWVISFILRRSP